MSKYIGNVSAYAYAVSKGYTGTEEEFAELMASYADVGQTAVTAAQTATAKASEAATSATTATNKATEASTSATSASGSATAASASASAASGSATQAAASATSASGSATAAAGSATTASTKASEASASATAAQTAQTAAEAAQTAAETAQEAAEEARDEAETTAESISASAAQIATNTANIAQLQSEVSALPTDGVVANSKQLLSENGTDNTEPYMFRAVQVNADRAELDAVVGGTVVWNQLVPDTVNGWIISHASLSLVDGSFKLVADSYAGLKCCDAEITSNHKILAYGEITPPESSNAIYGVYEAGNNYVERYIISGGSGKTAVSKVFNSYENAKNFRITHTTSASQGAEIIFKINVIDLTAMFGSTIADYIYQLEQSTAGAGVAFFRKLFPKDYYPYDAGTLKSVEGVSEKVTRDADNNVLGTYPLDSSLTLRGVPKLADGKLSYDGDRYLSDGTVERRYGIRTYQSGDESLANAITDGTNTVYKLTTMTIEESTPYRQLQICDPNGTEEFVTTGIVPVGHETRYPENLRAKIEGLPWDFSALIAPTEKTTTASRNYTTGSLLIMNNVLYKVTANIANGGTITPGTNVTATTLSEVISALQ